jgi:hypothetical protein
VTGAARLASVLASPRLPLLLAGAALLLGAPSVGVGLKADDYFLKLALSDPPIAPEWSRSPALLFAFFRDEAAVRSAIGQGAVPWWTSPELRLAFFRPLAGLTHWLDFRLWPDAPWLMHAHSLAWFAALAAVAASLYRRVLGAGLVAGVAALAYTLDDAHASPAAWIANRNALLGTVFGLLALLAHDRWRREGWARGRILAPLFVGMGLLGGEIALAAFAYLLAYALFLERGSWAARLASLVPCGLVGLAWTVAYRALGFGAGGSAMYVDPGGDPAAFGRALAERAPGLLMGLWTLPSQLGLVLSEPAARTYRVAACALAVLLGVLLVPLLRQEARARFFALGMGLSLVPAAATFPHDRLLPFAAFGAAGLVAQLLAGLWVGAAWRPASAAWRVLAEGLGVVLALFHFVLAPLLVLRAPADLRLLGGLLETAAASLPAEAVVAGQDVIVVHTPAAFLSIQGLPIRALSGQPVPRRLLVMGSGRGGATVERPAREALRVRPEGGFLFPRGRALPGEAGSAPAFAPRYLLSVFDSLYRDDPMMPLGTRITLPGLAVEVTRLTADGRPAEATFTFDRDLDHPSLRWLRWEDGRYVSFVVPAAGSRVELAALADPFS